MSFINKKYFELTLFNLIKLNELIHSFKYKI